MALTHLVDINVLTRLAADAGLARVQYDADFDLISRATGQRCEWVVAARTID